MFSVIEYLKFYKDEEKPGDSTLTLTKSSTLAKLHMSSKLIFNTILLFQSLVAFSILNPSAIAAFEQSHEINIREELDPVELWSKEEFGLIELWLVDERFFAKWIDQTEISVAENIHRNWHKRDEKILFFEINSPATTIMNSSNKSRDEIYLSEPNYDGLEKSINNFVAQKFFLDNGKWEDFLRHLDAENLLLLYSDYSASNIKSVITIEIPRRIPGRLNALSLGFTRPIGFTLKDILKSSDALAFARELSRKENTSDNSADVLSFTARVSPSGFIIRPFKEFAKKCRECDFSGSNLSNIKDFWEYEWLHSDLFDADFSAASITGSSFSGSNLIEANFDSSTLINSDLSATNLSHASFEKALISNTLLDRAILNYSNFQNARLERLDLSGGQLLGIVLRDSSITQVNLSQAILLKANLSGAHLDEVNLAGANLNSADLSNADLSGVNLSGANLSQANLSGTNLAGANLAGADLSDTVLIDTNFSETNLAGTDISRTDLSKALFNKAVLSGASFRGSVIGVSILEAQTIYGAKFNESTIFLQDFDPMANNLVLDDSYEGVEPPNQIELLEPVVVLEPDILVALLLFFILIKVLEKSSFMDFRNFD